MTIYDFLEILQENPQKWWDLEDITKEYNGRYGMHSTGNVVKMCLARHSDVVAIKRVKEGRIVTRSYKLRQKHIPGNNCIECGESVQGRNYCEGCR